MYDCTAGDVLLQVVAELELDTRKQALLFSLSESVSQHNMKGNLPCLMSQWSPCYHCVELNNYYTYNQQGCNTHEMNSSLFGLLFVTTKWMTGSQNTHDLQVNQKRGCKLRTNGSPLLRSQLLSVLIEGRKNKKNSTKQNRSG